MSQVLGSNRNGEKAAGLKPYPDVIQEAGQSAGGYKPHRNQKIVKNLIKRGLKIMRFYDDSRNAKWSHVGRNRTESAAICVLNMDIFFKAN